VGSTLTAKNGTWSGTKPIRVARTWLRCGPTKCEPISGARSRAYKLRASDAGSTIRFEERATSRAGTRVARSSATSVVRPPAEPQAPSESRPPETTPTEPNQTTTYETVPPPVDP
jgi:hypothetical protein